MWLSVDAGVKHLLMAPESKAVFTGEHDALADAVIEGGRERKLMGEDEIAK